MGAIGFEYTDLTATRAKDPTACVNLHPIRDPRTISDTHIGDDPGLNRILAAGAEHGLPINILCWGRPELLSKLARRNPKTQVVLDHVGLKQPLEPPVPPDPFSDLANVLSLAQYENVAIKISGACTLSHQPFPYRDIWEPLGQIFEAFGFERCLRGTDWTRAVELLTYEQGGEAFRVTDQLSDSERAALMGAGWPASTTGRRRLRNSPLALPVTHI